jgi:hypothetical protein
MLPGKCAILPTVMLTIREAAEKTGHSPHKIRRLIKAIADQTTHADRPQIEPGAADVERLTAEGVQFTWRITEELVRRELGETVAPASGESESGTAGGGESADLMNLLQRTIDAKEKAEARLFEQLRVKDEQIAALHDRLRESNVLMQSLQKQLPEPAKTPVAVMEATKPTSAGRPDKKTPPVIKKQKRRWLGKIFAARR